MSRAPQRFPLPLHSPGLRIGLFGGSFNPPHVAHRAASLLAMKRLDLDRIWWLVTPGNPLKDTRDLPPLATRVAAAREIAYHPRIDVTGIEQAFGTTYSCDTLALLLPRCRGVRFVWIMGADSLKVFHRWRNWRQIAHMVPIAVVDRPDGPVGGAGLAAGALARWRRPERDASSLAHRRPPAWIFLHGLRSPLSSTALRAGKIASRKG